MQAKDYNMDHVDNAWCPGCGNFPLLQALKQAVAELNISPQKLVVLSGIGQAAKISHYIKANAFNGLHGRMLPMASAVKAINPELTVICSSGDGDIYGEGGNHFIHTIRRNSDICNIVHNNMIYGLTKGQASPTSMIGLKTPEMPAGVITEPFNPLAVAIAMGATFVSRANAGDIAQTKEMIKKAIQHKGYALVDVFQPCIVFNKINTYQWFKEHTYYVGAEHNPQDKMAAFKVALDFERLALGVIYQSDSKKTFEEKLPIYQERKDGLLKRQMDRKKLQEVILGMK